jgi:ribosomal protein S11
MDRLKVWIVFGCVLSWPWLTAGCFVAPQPLFRHEAGPVESTVDFQGCRCFEAKLGNAEITIQGWDEPTVSLSAKVWARGYLADSAKRLAESTKVELQRTGDRVTVQYLPGVSLLGSECVGASLLVRLPRGAEVTATTSAGDVAAADMDGAVTLKASSGNITLTGSRGPVACRAYSGNITLTSPKAAVDCKTSSGDITITDPHESVTCRAYSGDIAVIDPRGAVDCQARSGDVRVLLGAGCWTGQSIKLEASSGNIDVRVLTPQ